MLFHVQYVCPEAQQRGIPTSLAAKCWCSSGLYMNETSVFAGGNTKGKAQTHLGPRRLCRSAGIPTSRSEAR